MTVTVRQPTTTRWSIVLIAVLLVIAAWPPDKDRSLAMKLVNWAVDPAGTLPILPPQLGFGVGDDLQAVEERDAEVRRYDALYNLGGWTRTRLQLKVARDPLNRSTERQLLLAGAAIVLFLVWRAGQTAA